MASLKLQSMQLNNLRIVLAGLQLAFAVACQQATNKPPIEMATPDPPIKAAWVTNVGSNVLLHKDSIAEAVHIAKEAGLTHLCVVVWNNGYTMYPSRVMEKYFGVSIDPVYGHRDPLQECIDAADAAGLGVIAWFEFGFSSSYGGGGQHILARYPHWAARDKEGNVLVENGFTWMNSFMPEVQDFLTQMVTEVAAKYKVYAVQGDDRLPAAPVRGGYDSLTVAMYQNQHKGALPPANHMDSAWIDWRANLMNDYAATLYRAVKKANPAVKVIHAPSIFPWSKEHYLQDWPTWLRHGTTEAIMPQVYRYQYDAYCRTLDDMVKQVGDSNLHRVFPGILTSLADGYLIREGFLDSCIQYNRSKGIQGEVFFYFEGMRRSPEFYREKYTSY